MDRRTTWILVGLTALGAGLRFATLDLQSYHHDEAVTAARVLGPDFGQMMSQVVDGERSPPLYYVLAWLWTRPFGVGEVGLRSLSALIGSAMIPAAFAAGRALASKRVGLVAAALFAVSPYLVWYSQEGRSYILMALFLTVALAGLASAIRGPRLGPGMVVWAVSSGLALCSHYFAVFLVAPMVVALILRIRPWRVTLAAIGAVTLIGLALLPLALAQQGDDRRDGFSDLPLAGRAGEVALNFAASEDPDPLAGGTAVDLVQIGASAGAGALFLLAALLIARRGTRRERSSALWVFSIAAFSLVAPVLLALVGLDLLNPRNLVGSLPPLLLVGAIGLGGSEARRLGTAGAVGAGALFLAVVGAVNVSAQMQREDWRAAAEAIGSTDEPRAIVIPKNGDDPMSYYLDAEKFHGQGRVRTSQLWVLSTNYSVQPPARFELRSKEGLAPIFVLWHFEAPQPQLLEPSDILGDKVLSERSAALVDEGS